jgi:Uma2 family endonuclease
MQWNDGYSELVTCFTNTIKNRDGGTHLTAAALRDALEAPILEYPSSAILDAMVDGVPLLPRNFPTDVEDSRVLLRDVPWDTYVMLNDAVDSPSVHMTYLDGSLEIMTKSPLHEVSTKQIARLVELFCLERDIPLYGYRETTVRNRRKKRGLEPDEWYSRRDGRWPPEIALEVVITNPLIDKLDVYRGLGVREVWVFKDGAFTVFSLRVRGGSPHYAVVERSRVTPEVDLGRVAYYLDQADQHVALKAFRAEIRRRASSRSRSSRARR